VPSDARLGSTLGDYTIESIIGRGGMSVVYLARHTKLERHVALKVMAEELSENEGFRTRFVREAKMAANLEHPNIVPVYDAGEIDGVLYLAMRVIRGTDLRRVITEGGPMDPERVLTISGQVASALDAAHRAGLVHRDVKPGNILLATDGDEEHAFLTDFGLTKHVSSKSGLTKTGTFLGTVDYVAPEQIRGGEVDGRTDEYSLGCVVYECLTGEVPFTKDQDVATLFAHVEGERPRVSSARPELPDVLSDAVARAMSKDKEERFDTCQGFVRAARAALAQAATVPNPTILAPPPVSPGPVGTPPETVPPAPPGPSGTAPTPAPPGRRRRWLGVAAIVAAVAIAGTVGAIALGAGDDPPVGPTDGATGTTDGATGSTGSTSATGATAATGATSASGTTGTTGSVAASGCSGGPAPTILPDGTHFGYVEGLETVSGAMAFDLACFYTGEEANRQAAAAGDEVPVPNDVYIVNRNTTIRNLTVDPSAKLVLIDWNRCCDPRPGADLDAFASALGNEDFVQIGGRSYAGSLSPYWVTIEEGIVTRIEEQFLP
jgi:tRNA A-37 threonylcarbamoyl transferase component Bud32